MKNKIIVVIILFTAMSCSQDKSQKKQYGVIQIDDDATHISWNFSAKFMDSSRIKTQLSAATARIYDEKKETLLNGGVTVEFMNKHSQRIGILTSDSARIDDNTKNMYAFGNVIVRSDSTATSLKSNVLMWDQQRQKLFTTEKVHIETPTEIIDGVGMESDQYLKNYQIFKVSGISRQY